MARLVIRGALVADGTGAPMSEADVEIDGDRIRSVGQVGDGGGPSLDATRLVLAPGFIDTHSHDDYAVALHPDMQFKIMGGVTTVVVGNCGIGAAPRRWNEFFVRMIHGDAELPDWKDFQDYFDYLDASPASVNVAALAGHGTIREGVAGRGPADPSPAQIGEMSSLVSKALEAGCVGVSTGLVYEPGRYATTEEIAQVASPVGETGGVYASHIRDEGDRLIEAVDEAIAIGQAACAPVVISHLKVAGNRNFGKVSDALARIDRAGPTVTADHYPYAAGSTGLAAVVDGGIRNTSPETVVIASTKDHPEWHGRSLADLADGLGVAPSEVGGVVLEAEPNASVVLHMMSEEDVRTAVARPDIMVGSDGVPTLDGTPHPRLYGTFARVIGRYGRDLGLLTIEQAVHKMTGRPAHVFGLADRGVIRPGAIADLVLFDPQEIVDLGTYEAPHRFPAGIHGVWVNGTRVVEQGTHNGARPGQVLKRSA